MALTPQRAWASVPSTQLSGPVDPHTRVGLLVPEVPEGQPMASCSPAGGGGRLFPATPESELTGEMVEVPARMPAHSRASTPSHGGREGIGTGVSRRPEANRRIAPFVYYSYRRKGNNTIKPSTAQAGRFLSLFRAAKRRNGCAASPPLMGIDAPLPSRRRGGRERARNLSDSGPQSLATHGEEGRGEVRA
jgi:hypothetical protein